MVPFYFRSGPLRRWTKGHVLSTPLRGRRPEIFNRLDYTDKHSHVLVDRIDTGKCIRNAIVA
jgi:hypothetical protein